jgi:hypothetical protein
VQNVAGGRRERNVDFGPLGSPGLMERGRHEGGVAS